MNDDKTNVVAFENSVSREELEAHFAANLPTYTVKLEKPVKLIGPYPSEGDEQCLMTVVNPISGRTETWVVEQRDDKIVSRLSDFDKQDSGAKADEGTPQWFAGPYMKQEVADLLNQPAEELQKWWKEQSIVVVEDNKKVRGTVIGFQATDAGYAGAIVATPANMRYVYGIDYKTGEPRYLGAPKSTR